MTLSRETRRNLLDYLAAEGVQWYGRLDDVAFLSRVYDLTELPSYDYRFHDAEADIRQHRENNNDWDNDWVFGDERFELRDGPDDVLLRFLAEMVHPVVRPDVEGARELVETMNDFLRGDGYELVERTRLAGKPVWAAVRRALDGASASPAIRGARATFDADYILRQITRMETAIQEDPALAIGTAKELVETTCKAILEARHMPISGKEDVGDLVHAVSRDLGLRAADDHSRARDPETVRKVLGALNNVMLGIADLRNSYGTGHGRSPASVGLEPRHARLTVSAASAVAVFLWETHQARPIQVDQP